MSYRGIRVVIVSGDRVFCRMVEERLRTHSNIELISNALSLLSVKQAMGKLAYNLLLIDLDSATVYEAILRQLTEKNRLHIILTAESPHMAVPYTQVTGRSFLKKPRSFVDVYINSFISSLMTQANDFVASLPKLNYHGMQRTVDSNQKIVVVASSTGGTEAIEVILRGFQADMPPMLVVQHMPSGFTEFFANRLNNIYPMEVREAKDNDYLQKGLVLIAPAGKHMRLVRRSSRLMVECFIGQKIHGVMPSADILFESVAPLMRSNVVGVILTGMGADGARGLMLMHNSGAKTIGQNKETCVVYGMPKVAYDLGALDVQLPIEKIAAAILKFM